MDDDGNTSSENSMLEQNCREDWPRWICIVGNVAGLCSTTLWFLVLLPQVWKNFRRKSVKGLSVLWATANFTASLVNLFFVFMYAHIPIYGQISSIYCPVLEFMLLIQFWMYGNNKLMYKVLYLCVCAVLWGTIIAVEFLFSVEGTVEYVAIGLWCIETFPQIILNMKLRSTSGQSFGSVFIAMVGKTTDMTCNNILVLPLQYIIMVYFSSSVAYINGLQVAWYYGNNIDPQLKQNEKEDRVINKSNDSLVSRNSSIESYACTKLLTKFGFRRINNVTDMKRMLSLFIILILLVVCAIAFVWNIQSLYGMFAPVSIAVVLITSRGFFYFSGREDYSMSHLP